MTPRTGRRHRSARAGLLGFLLLVAVDARAQQTFESTRVEVVTATASHPFTVELARTAAQRARGLMFRRSLRGDAGMLFDFRVERSVGMWMKNTLIPLDMLFIDATGAIVQVEHSATPGDLRPIKSERPVRAVLELAGGRAARLGIAEGDRVRHRIFDAETPARRSPEAYRAAPERASAEPE